MDDLEIVYEGNLAPWLEVADDVKSLSDLRCVDVPLGLSLMVGPYEEADDATVAMCKGHGHGVVLCLGENLCRRLRGWRYEFIIDPEEPRFGIEPIRRISSPSRAAKATFPTSPAARLAARRGDGPRVKVHRLVKAAEFHDGKEVPQ